MIGSKLGSYEVEEEIGRGGMGVVYRASQPKLRRQVAVKVLLPHLARDAEFVERFMREARAAAQLHHPGLVTIFDVGERDGTYFFSMQWLQGKTLEEKLEEPGALPVEEVVGVVSQMAAALGFAHEAGVVHRDVKPANVIVDDLGRAVLTDFGIAQAANETRLTRAGSAVGSPDYMAPEQISADPIDARTDLYALGALFHHLLTGEPPYAGDAPIAVAYQHLNAPVPSVREKRPEVAPELDDVVGRLMAKAPEDRYQSADELLAALRDIPDLEVDIGNIPIAAGAHRRTAPTPLPVPASAGGPLSSTLARVLLAVLAVVALGSSIYWGMGRGPAAGEADGDTPGAVSTGAPAEPPSEPAVQPFSALVEIQPDLPPTQKTFTISSQPPGARVALDGEPLAGVTPLAVSLTPGRDYQLALTLAGHEPAGSSFALEELSAEQRESAKLHFVLRSSIPPAELVVLADYRVTVAIEGRRQSGTGEIRLSVPPGSHTVELSAPDVFYGDKRSVVLESEESRTLELPRTVTIPVAAEGRCRLSIDGREVGDLPARVELTIGFHQFRFEWEGGLVKEERHNIGISTQRIFEVMPS